MNLIRDPREAVSGILLLLLGAGIYFAGRDLPFGEWTKLGPAALPTMIAVLLAAIGVVLIARSFAYDGELPKFGHLRRLGILLFALILAGALLEPLGLVPALFAMMVTAGMADSKARILEAILFSGVMTFLAVALFVWGLGLPIRLFP